MALSFCAEDGCSINGGVSSSRAVGGTCPKEHGGGGGNHTRIEYGEPGASVPYRQGSGVGLDVFCRLYASSKGLARAGQSVWAFPGKGLVALLCH